MANEYYTETGVPVTLSQGSSSAVRSEFTEIGSGFDLLPVLAGNGGKAILVNTGGTALEAVLLISQAIAVTGNSTTSNTIGTGAKTWTIETGKAFAAGMEVKIVENADPVNNFVTGVVTDYDTVTGVLSVTVTGTTGSGTFTAWTATQTNLILAGNLDASSFKVENSANATASGDLTNLAMATAISLYF